MTEVFLATSEVYMKDITITIGDPIGVGKGKIHAEMPDDEAAAQELADDVRRHIKNVDPDAPSSCIDGRHCIACMDGEPSEPRPGVAGGGLISAYAGAELIGWFPDEVMSSAERLDFVLDQLEANGLKTGAHCDEAKLHADFKNNEGLNATGCGADDNLPKIMQTLHENTVLVNSYVDFILGDDMAQELTYVSAERLQERHQDWDPKAMLDCVGNVEGPHSVEVLDSGDSTSTTSGHGELALVLNDAEDTTVDRDGLFAETGKQVFDVDVWYLRKLAKAMASGPEAETQEAELLRAMVAYQVATYLTLADGSHRPIMISRNSVALAA